MRNSSILLLTYGKYFELDERNPHLFLDGVSFASQFIDLDSVYEFCWRDGVYSRVLIEEFKELEDDIAIFGKDEMISMGIIFLSKLNNNNNAQVAKEYIKNVPTSFSKIEWLLINNIIGYFYKRNLHEYLSVSKLHNINDKMKRVSKRQIQEALDRFNILSIHIG